MVSTILLILVLVLAVLFCRMRNQKLIHEHAMWDELRRKETKSALIPFTGKYRYDAKQNVRRLLHPSQERTARTCLTALIRKISTCFLILFVTFLYRQNVKHEKSYVWMLLILYPTQRTIPFYDIENWRETLPITIWLVGAHLVMCTRQNMQEMWLRSNF